MTIRGCKVKLQKLIELAMDIRMAHYNPEKISFYEQIDDPRIEILENSVNELINEITTDKKYRSNFGKIPHCEEGIWEVQKKLTDLKLAIELMEILNFED